MNQEQRDRLSARIARDCGNAAGVVVLKDGETRYEAYFNGCTAQSRIHVYSVTKSILSILIGIALDRGHIKGLDQKVLDFFPDYAVPEGERAIHNVTLRHLLTMTAPYKYGEDPYAAYFTSGDAVKFTLDQLGGGEPGAFRYTPIIGPDILSGVLMRATGRPVLDFAAEALFAPLGITVAGSVVFHSAQEQMAFNQSTTASGWVADAMGVNAGGWGLTLSPADMAKLGQLYLNGGVWDGKRVVSAQWVDDSTREHSRWAELGLPFGYLWWVTEDGFAAMGDGGNVICVNPGKGLVVAIASLFQPGVTDRLDFIKEAIEPMFE